ncbi:MAG TPA: dihydroorotase, partial [Usitatibacter sp.]|nr:dihydroorotase [Usitatibacter sp.]
HPGRRRGGGVMSAARKNGSILIKGGRVVDPAQNIDADMDLLLRDGFIAELAPKGKVRGSPDESFDARGLVVTPGFVDLHVHLREPGHSHKETIATGTRAAAAGGFTSVCCMPNTSPVNDSAKTTAWMLEPERGAVVNVFPVAAATLGSEGKQLSDYAALQKAGAVGVTDDGKPILDENVMRDALRLAGSLNLPVVQHAEDTHLTSHCVMHEGPTAFRLGLRGMSADAEASVVERDVNIARNTNGHLHVAHISTAAALKAVRRGKKLRARVTCEVTPHHFSLLDEHVADYNTNCKMNPPLRSAADREAILAALDDGAIDAIATDHAPHAAHEKEVEFDRAPFGITGLETALALAITKLHRERKMSLLRLVELLSTNPARIFNLRGRGSLVRGSFADVTIFDPAKRWTFEASKSLSRSKNTPFDGWQFVGKVVATLVSGKFVHRNG